jgi:hypothetical protein
MSIYDKEDDKYYFSENNTVKINLTTTQTAEISIEAYFDDGELPEEADVIINCTNTTIPDSAKITDELEGYMDIF